MRRWDVCGESFLLTNRYKIIDFLGAGSFGTVAKVVDLKEQSDVAIKKCINIFRSRTLTVCTLREIRLLRLLKHENIVLMIRILKPADLVKFSDLYLVFEVMETDLGQLLKSSIVLQEEQIELLFYQLLRGLEYIHKGQVMHRDIKPRNLLVNSDCRLKIADFGLARFYSDVSTPQASMLSGYVTTRWYRAPEVIVGWTNYSCAVDIWAAGCILAEMLSRMPLFPGVNRCNQLTVICKCLGKPSRQFLETVRVGAVRKCLGRIPEAVKVSSIESHLEGLEYDPNAIDLIKRLVEIEPQQRLTASAALHHPYLSRCSRYAGLMSPTPEAPKISVQDFPFEQIGFNDSHLPREIVKEIFSQSEYEHDVETELAELAPLMDGTGSFLSTAVPLPPRSIGPVPPTELDGKCSPLEDGIAGSPSCVNSLQKSLTPLSVHPEFMPELRVREVLARGHLPSGRGYALAEDGKCSPPEEVVNVKVDGGVPDPLDSTEVHRKSPHKTLSSRSLPPTPTLLGLMDALPVVAKHNQLLDELTALCEVLRGHHPSFESLLDLWTTQSEAEGRVEDARRLERRLLRGQGLTPTPSPSNDWPTVPLELKIAAAALPDSMGMEGFLTCGLDFDDEEALRLREAAVYLSDFIKQMNREDSMQPHEDVPVQRKKDLESMAEQCREEEEMNAALP